MVVEGFSGKPGTGAAGVQAGIAVQLCDGAAGLVGNVEETLVVDREGLAGLPDQVRMEHVARPRRAWRSAAGDEGNPFIQRHIRHAGLRVGPLAEGWAQPVEETRKRVRIVA